MRTVLALIGPKGAGKTHLGRMLERELDVDFIDVEAVFRALPGPRDVAEGYSRVEALVSERLATRPTVSLELTGAAPEAEDLLRRLAEAATLRLVRVQAPLEVCLRRIAQRDASRQLPASEALIRQVHHISEALRLPWDLAVRTDQDSDAAVLDQVQALLQEKSA